MSAHDNSVNSAYEQLTPAPARGRARTATPPAKDGAGDVPIRPSESKVNASLQAEMTRWQFHTLRDAFIPRPPIEYLIAGVFSAGSLNIVYGAPGTLKTMLLIDAAIAVMTGTKWLPPMPNAGGVGIVTKAAPVMLVDFDSGLRRTAERIEALARSRRLNPDTAGRFDYVSMPTPWLTASQRDSVLQLADEIKSHGSRFVVIDNLGVITGGIDENSSEMVGVMSNLRWLTEYTGACVVLIHHERKSTGEARKGGDALRGHSSINAALDLALLVEREGASRVITVRSTKTRDVDVDSFGAEFNFTHKAGSTELDVAWFWGVHDSGDDDSDKAIERHILEACFSAGQTGMNASQVVAAIKDKMSHVGAKRVRALADSLVEREKLLFSTGLSNSKIYKHP
jgi:hypothetical protein